MRWEIVPGLLGLGLLVTGQALGLFWAPPDQHMGEVARILFVHVPAAWLALVAFTVAFGAALASLFSGRPGADALVESSIEVGCLLNALLLVLGSLFARPTWGVWWDWDPRLTASAVMLLTFVGVLLLRAMVEDADRKQLWSAVATVLAYVNIPVTYFSVRWWRSLHQVQSSPNTMSDDMVLVLRINAFAFLFVMIWMMAVRWRIARARAIAAAPPPLPGESA
jgi:heme exporter protein C